MNWVGLSFILISVGGVGLLSEGATSSRPPVIKVGALFGLNTTHGKVASIAFKAAEEDVNSDPNFLGGSKLRIMFSDAKRSGFLSIMGALQFMKNDVVAIIGPQTSIMAHVLPHFANELTVPMLSYTALDPSLSPLQFPFFVQTAPSNLFLMRAIAEMVTFYGWSDVVALYNDDDGSRNGVTALRAELEERCCKISYKAVLPLDVVITSPVEIREELIKIRGMESRVIVVNAFANTGKMIFEEAKRLGMMGKGYVWIATTWLSSILDSDLPSNLKSFNGVLTLRLHTPNSRKKRDFAARWKNKLNKNKNIGLNAYGLYAYDTVWIIARAVKAHLEAGGNISFSHDAKLRSMKDGGALALSALSRFNEGSQLLDYIVHTKMSGLTGQVQIHPDRSMLHPSYDIINVVDGRLRQIGYWSNYSGLSTVSPESFYSKPPNRSSSNQHLKSVTWPGGTLVTPRGWVFPNNGRRLRIGVPHRASFRDFVSRVNGSSNEAKGYSIDVFEAAVKLLSYPVPHEFIFFGDGLENPNYTELVDKVSTGVDFDAAVGDIAIVTRRTKIVDFTQPYIESGLVVVAPVTALDENPWVFLRPFTPMWAVTAALFIGLGAVIWILEHRENDELQGLPRRQIVTNLCFTFSALFFSNRDSTVSTLGRTVLLIWLSVVLIIRSSYTASLGSILTVQQLQSPIKGIDTLMSSTGRIGFQVGSFAENYMVDELNILRSRLLPLSSPKEYASALQNGTVAAIVDERPYIDLFLSEYCKFSIRGQDFTSGGWGFAFPRDSPLAVDMSTAILNLSEAGELKKIHDRWLSKSNCSNSHGAQSSDSEQLHVHSFWGMFLLFGVVCLVALLFHFFKIVRHFCKHKPEEEAIPSTENSFWKKLQSFRAYFDSKEEEPKRRMKRKRNNHSVNTNSISRSAARRT